MNEVKTKEASRLHHEEMQREAAQELAAKIDGKTVVLHAKGGESGRLFGAVTVKDIAGSGARQRFVRLRIEFH